MPKHLNYDEPVLRYHQVVASLTADLVPRGGSVVDLGCGPGQVLSELARRRHDVKLHGVDGDDECLRLAAGRAPQATLTRDDICDPAILRDGSFDVVLSSHALEHLPNPADTLQHWASSLKPSGRLVIAVPNSHQPIFLAQALVRRGQANEGHFYVWDRATFDNFCRLAGFTVERWEQDYVPLAPVRVRQRIPPIAWVERLLLRFVPAFANSHIVVLKPDPGSSGSGDVAGRSVAGREHVGQEAAGVTG